MARVGRRDSRVACALLADGRCLYHHRAPASARFQAGSLTVRRIITWPVAFAMFWYHFIIGDDWTVAAAVATGLILTALLNSAHLLAWWLMPLIVVVMLGLSLRRA